MLKIVRSLFKPHTKDMFLCQIFVCALPVVAIQKIQQAIISFYVSNLANSRQLPTTQKALIFKLFCKQGDSEGQLNLIRGPNPGPQTYIVPSLVHW